MWDRYTTTKALNNHYIDVEYSAKCILACPFECFSGSTVSTYQAAFCFLKQVSNSKVNVTVHCEGFVHIIGRIYFTPKMEVMKNTIHSITAE